MPKLAVPHQSSTAFDELAELRQDAALHQLKTTR